MTSPTGWIQSVKAGRLRFALCWHLSGLDNACCSHKQTPEATEATSSLCHRTGDQASRRLSFTGTPGPRLLDALPPSAVAVSASQRAGPAEGGVMEIVHGTAPGGAHISAHAPLARAELNHEATRKCRETGKCSPAMTEEEDVGFGEHTTPVKATA